jgi:hypothetical protein
MLLIINQQMIYLANIDTYHNQCLFVRQFCSLANYAKNERNMKILLFLGMCFVIFKNKKFKVATFRPSLSLGHHL